MSNLLPIWQIKSDFISALQNSATLVLSAEPGAGKSTQLPLWLLEDNVLAPGKIYLVQPRRIAAKNVAHFLAKQLGQTLGQVVGYRLRDESKVSKQTRLEVITEGVLIQIIQNDPELSGCSMVILDEFHERSLQADIAFALLRDVQLSLRDDLKLLLMSATLANDTLAQALPEAKFLTCPGRSYPISYSYQPIPHIQRWREHAINVILQASEQYSCSMLVFLPGSGDIQYIAKQLTGRLAADMIICPLFGTLTLSEQQKAIAPTAKQQRKIVLATNVAETSLTIEGISLVIDSGLEKVACFDDNSLTNHLVQRNIAKSSAVQRAGRAGRLAAGHCIRLFSEEEFQRRPLHAPLAIFQADLLPLIIEAARWGVRSLKQLPLLDMPNAITEQGAWQSLADLKMLDSEKRLTVHGEQASKLPCHPRFAHMLLMADKIAQQQHISGLVWLACILAAILEERDVFSAEQARDNCDLRQRVNLFASAKKHHRLASVDKQAQRLTKLMHCQSENALPMQYIGELVALAYPERIAKARGQHGEFLAAYGKGLTISEQDPLASESYIVASNVTASAQPSSKQGLKVRLAAPVDINCLLAWQIVALKMHTELSFDNQQQRINAFEQERIGAIVVKQQTKSSVSAEQLFALWQAQIEKNGLSWLNWREQDQALLARWRWLIASEQVNDFPDISEQGLFANMHLWLAPFVDGVTTKAKLDKLDLSEQLLSMLDYQQQQILARLAPAYFVGPTGRRCPIRYPQNNDNGQAPIVSLPMQELYGLAQGPSVGDQHNKKAVALVLELLSPAQRPIQITQDLAGFWQSSYRAVQKEMKAKYPKHYWPDDPANAQATNKTKKHLSL